jgi:hypothetical protein
MLSANGWAERAEWLKQDERSTVLAGDSAAGPVVVKSLLVDRPKDLLSRALGVTRLMRQWRGAEVLALRGFVVARPLVLWRGRDDAGRVVESLAMERHAGKTVLRHLADGDLSAEMEAAVARRIGEDVARLARLGLVNRDHKPSNLLLHPSEPQAASLKPVIAILDTVGVRRSRSPREAAVRMLFGLTVECVGTGVLPRLSTRLTVVRAAAAGLGLPRREVAWLWLDVRERLGRHGDPRPRVDPLG